MKKYVLLSLSILLFIGLLPANTLAATKIHTSDFTIISKKVITTLEIKSEDAIVFSYPEKETSESFEHKIYDRNGILMATVTTTIKGWYCEVDRDSWVSKISYSVSGDFADNISGKTSKSGNTASLKLYFNGVYLKTFKYKINYNGLIEQI